MKRFVLCGLVCAACLAPRSASAFPDIVTLDMDDRLTTGYYNTLGAFALGKRTFSDEFLSNNAVDDPGWNTFGAGSPDLPAGGEPLPAHAALEWDWLPMKIDGVTSNLFHWDGVGSVDFNLPPAGHAMALQDKDGAFFAIDGSPDIVPGGVIDDTDGDGLLHRHRDWAVADLDTGNAPADGVYFGALRNRMHSLDRNKPLYVLFATNGTPNAVQDAAVAWADTVVDDLTPDLSADFNGDLEVDAADLAVLETGFGTVGSSALQEAGDATWDDEIALPDFLEWQRQFGLGISSSAGATSPAPAIGLAGVPEPASALLLALAAAAWSSRRPGRAPRA